MSTLTVVTVAAGDSGQARQLVFGATRRDAMRQDFAYCCFCLKCLRSFCIAAMPFLFPKPR